MQKKLKNRISRRYIQGGGGGGGGGTLKYVSRAVPKGLLKTVF